MNFQILSIKNLKLNLKSLRNILGNLKVKHTKRFTIFQNMKNIFSEHGCSDNLISTIKLHQKNNKYTLKEGEQS